MSVIQFGDGVVAAFPDFDNNNMLSICYTTGPEWKISKSPFVLGGMPLTSYTDGAGNYSLAVILETGTNTGLSFSYFGNPFSVSTNTNGEHMLNIVSTNNENSIFGHTVWLGQAFPYNKYNQLLLTNITGEAITQVEYPMWGGIPMKVGLVNFNWYLIACDYG